MPLFEIAILVKPTKKEYEEEGKTETLVFGPEAVVARDAQAAGIGAVMKTKTELELDPSKIEVLVRPFA